MASRGPLATHRLPLCPQITQLLTRGNRQRTQEPTAANKTSSRSHAVLQVTVRQRSRGADVPEEVRVGRLFMVDLAGSERASQVLCRPHSYSPCSLRAGLPLPRPTASAAPRAAPGPHRSPLANQLQTE